MNGGDPVGKTARTYRAAYNVLSRWKSGIEWGNRKLRFIGLARWDQQNGVRPVRMSSHMIPDSWCRLTQSIDHMNSLHVYIDKAEVEDFATTPHVPAVSDS